MNQARDEGDAGKRRTGVPEAFRWALESAADPSHTSTDWLAKEIVAGTRNAATAVAGAGTTLEELIAMKVAFKAVRQGATTAAERNRAARLYAATIAAALVRFDQRITRIGEQALRSAFLALYQDEATEEPLRDMARVALTRLR